MVTFARPLLLVTLLVGLVMVLPGCGSDDCADDPTQPGCQQVGGTQTWRHSEDVVIGVPYAKGQNVKINGDYGNIDVVLGGQLGSIDVTFKRFTLGPSDGQTAAFEEMEQKLELTAVLAPGSTVEVVSRKLEGANGGLGCDVVVSLPVDFVGGFTLFNTSGSTNVDLTKVGAAWTTVQNENGELVVRGAGGQLDIGVRSGTSASVSVRNWAPETSKVEVDVLDFSFTVTPGTNGSLEATSSAGNVAEPNPLPGDWFGNASNSDVAKSFSFGAEPHKGGKVTLINSGNIALLVGAP